MAVHHSSRSGSTDHSVKTTSQPKATWPDDWKEKAKGKKAKGKKAKAPKEELFDHSPKPPEKAAAQDAELDALAKAAGPLPKGLGVGVVKQVKRKKEPANDQRVITLLASGNPKKPGSATHGRFALYRSGMTVAQFLAAGGTSADVNWDVKHGFISLK